MEDGMIEAENMVRGGKGKEHGEKANTIGNLISNSVSEDEKEEEKVGGIIAHIISNLVSPLSTPRAGEIKKRKLDLFEVEDGGKCEDGGSVRKEEDGGGVISNLISNFFHQGEGEGGQKDGDGKEKVNIIIEESKEVKTDEEKGGGGIINNLVFHLPTSLPDDAAPTTDEATILIHSIVRD